MEISTMPMKLDRQKKWLESQSRYGVCLEKMIRDTMQQCIAYKEQARRNQDACTALVARLESQRKICDLAEEKLKGLTKEAPKFVVENWFQVLLHNP